MEKKTNVTTKLDYTTAFKELQNIVRDMENADISVDELAEKIKRCTLLIQICKDKLEKTEAEVASLIRNEE